MGALTNVGQSVSFYNPKPLNPYSERWNLDVQRQFGTNYVLEVGYEGNHGVHLAENVNLNAVPIEYFNNLRADYINNIDFSVTKNIRITERIPFQLRFEFFNFLNHPTYAAPNLSPTSSAVGTVTSDQANNPREIQIGGRIAW